MADPDQLQEDIEAALIATNGAGPFPGITEGAEEWGNQVGTAIYDAIVRIATTSSHWHTGSGAPAGGLGVVGDFYLDGDNGDFYEKTGASTWTLQGNIEGPQGPTGATGPQGAQGVQGPAGDGVPLGVPMPFFGSEAQVPTGWALCDGSTVGSGASSADHADDGYETVFAILRESAPNAANEVWANDETVVIPDLRGRAVAGKDDMGGSSANRVTDAQADALGGTLGAEDHTLTVGEMPSHNHGGGNHNHGYNEGNNTQTGGGASRYANNSPQDANTNNSGAIIDSQGGGGAHNNVQPTMFLNYIVRLV